MTDYAQTPACLTEHVLEREGCPIHFWLGGPATRPLLVLMHGAMMDHCMFNAQVEVLVADYRVLVWDARGHGRSKPIGSSFTLEVCAQDMLAILDEIGVEQALIGGQSFGGYIAQHIYMQAPQRVQAMIIIGSTPIGRAYSKTEIWALKATMPLFHLWPYDHLTKTIARNTALTDSVQNYALHACRQINHKDFLTIWKAVTLSIDEKGKPAFFIQTPLLLMHGDGDKTGTIRHDMAPWAERESDARFVLIPAAGHNANQDNPTFTNQAILAFLAQRAG